MAVDVGHEQLRPELRDDVRVTVREGLNVRDLVARDVRSPGGSGPGLVVGDLSFISLQLVLPVLARALDGDVAVLLLVKPQFEVGRERLGSGGVVRDRGLRARAVADVLECAEEHRLVVRAVVPSALPGPSGNREYFVLLATGGANGGTARQADGLTRSARFAAKAREAVSWDPPDTLAAASPTMPPVICLSDDEPEDK
ncbi:hypothetical protein GCM10025865_30760 [Paraoerskovia sediminicola]|uniref:Ribosomal RNA methyltransferase FtsJ domain-containing protein n=1 Tax=Paraoerskovia sediminicola TaxID=1138587 RepID=A0ABN6XFU1_9CELL|nr:hypothetical protein GCM10025865_30760 [Paraoerskovia sediminicola]